MVNISIKNNGVKPWLFEYWRKYVFDAIKHFSSFFSLKTTIQVIFQRKYKDRDNNYSSAAAVARHKKNNIYIIEIYDITLYKAIDDDKYNMDAILFHEICHIFDMLQVSNIPYSCFNPNKLKRTDRTDAIMGIGYDFWTEIFAYYMTKKCIEPQDELPLNRIVEEYDKLLQNQKELPVSYPHDFALGRQIDKYMDMVDDVLMLMSMYIANNINKSYKTSSPLIVFHESLKPILLKMLKEPYEKSMTKDFFALGNIIIEKYYKTLGMDLVDDGYFKVVYMFRGNNT